MSIITIALCFGAVPLTGLLAWIINLMAFHWHGFDELRLALLGRVALYLAALLFVIEIALAMVLSVRAFKAGLGREGATVDVTGNDDAAPSQVTATVTNSAGDTASASVPVAPGEPA